MSTIKVTNVNPPTAGDAVNINGLAYPTGGPLSSRNLIVNGAMAVAQRGTSSTTNGYGTVDRYKASYSGGTVTQTQTAITSGDPYDEGFRSVLRLTNTTANTGTSANRIITQKIEAQNMANSGWNYTSSTSYVTLSFWARASVAQTYYVNLKTSDGTSQNYSTSFALSADTWTKVTKTIPGNSSVAFDDNNEQGLQVHIVVFRGTDSTTSGHTLDAWAAYSGSDIVPDMTNTWANTADATFDVTGVQLEVGQVATPFEHRSYADELARCQRYYWNLLLEKGQTDLYLGNASQYNSTLAFMVLHPPVTMRTEPSIDVSNTTSHFASLGNNSATDFDTFSLDGRSGATAVTLSASVSGTTGHALFMRSQNTDAKLAFSAEL